MFLWAFQYRAEVGSNNYYDNIDKLEVNAWYQGTAPKNGKSNVTTCLDADTNAIPDKVLTQNTPYFIKRDNAQFCGYMVQF